MYICMAPVTVAFGSVIRRIEDIEVLFFSSPREPFLLCLRRRYILLARICAFLLVKIPKGAVPRSLYLCVRCPN